MAETQTQAGGVAPEQNGTIAPAPQSSGQPDAQGGPAQGGPAQGGGAAQGGAAQFKQSWTDDPEYRRLQAERDRREAMARAEALAERQRREALEQQLQQLQLASADPEERSRVLEQQLQQMRQQQMQMQRQQEILLEAAAMVQDAGYEPEDFANDFPEPTERGLLALAKAVVRRAKADEAEARKEAALAHERGRQVALAEAGVTRTSNQAGPTMGKAEEIRRQMESLRGTGRVAEYMELRRQLSQAEG